MEDPVFQAGIN